MENLKRQIKKQIAINDWLINDIQHKISCSIEGTLIISTMADTIRYYWLHNGKREYINKQKKELLKPLAEKYYDTKVLTELNNQTQILQRALKTICKLEDKPIQDYVHENLHAAMKEIVTKQNYLDNYAQQWQAVTYKRKPVSEEIPFYTDKNEHVRSKSELIIANMLNDYKIPYHYEFPLDVGDRTLSPDFLVLNTRTRDVYVLEHFGRLEDPEYAIKAIKKIEAYEMNGYFLGEKLLATFESSQVPFNMQIMAKLINKYLL